MSPDAPVSDPLPNGKAKKPKGSVSPFRREGSPYWYVRREIRGVGNVTLSTHTTSQARARRFDDLLLELRDNGRLDVIRALKQRRISLVELYANRSQPDALLERAESPSVRGLVDEWLSLGARDRGIRDRSMQRYASSWRRIWEVLPASATLRDITADFVSEFKRHRYAQADALGTRLSSATLKPRPRGNRCAVHLVRGGERPLGAAS